VPNLDFASTSFFNSAICGQGCKTTELPVISSSCFGTNERQTHWFILQINSLPGRSDTVGAPAGKLRFKIIPCDLPPNGNNCDATLDSPRCNCDLIDSSSAYLNDNGNSNIGNTDLDYMLFRINDFRTRRAACSSISNSNSTVVCCNWSANFGPTGMFEIANGFSNSCDQGALGTRYGEPINVRVGDKFILAIDQYTTGITRSFKINFTGDGANTTVHGLSARTGGCNYLYNKPLNTQFNRIISNTDSCSINSFSFNFGQKILNSNVSESDFKIFKFNEYEAIDSSFQILSVLPTTSPIYDSAWQLNTNTLTSGKYALRYIDTTLTNCGNIISADTIFFSVGGSSFEVLATFQDSCLFQPTMLSVPNLGFANFRWSNGETTNSIMVNGAGTYSVSATRTGTCRTIATSTFTLTQGRLRNCPITITRNTAQDSLRSSLSALGFQWERDGSTLSSSTRSISITANGAYRVRAINGSDTSNWSAPFLVTSNKASLAKGEMKVFPNPSKGLVNLEFPAPAQQIEVVDNMGRVVLTKVVNASSITLNLQAYAKGTYIIKAKMGGKVMSAQVVLE